MKIIVTLGLLLAGCFSLLGQEMPDWVRERPVSSVYYIGIGRSDKSDKDYIRTAKQNALKDLASEIRVQVSSNSLLHTLEGEEGNIDTRFEETIRVGVCEEIEKFHMAGTWQNEQEYWVYYELSVIDYEEYREKKRQIALRQGYDFWTKGTTALKEGELMTALEFWVKGLETVQPVMNEELECAHESGRIDIGCELYASLKNAFKGVVLSADQEILEAKAYRPVERPVVLNLSKDGMPMKHVSLKAVFLRGEGRLGEGIRTDEEGKAELYIENITASLPRQQVEVNIDAAAFSPLLNGIFGKVVKEVLSSAPRTQFRLDVAQENMKACIQVKNGADASLVRAVKDLLSRNRFVMVDRLSAADLEINISAEIRKGEKQRAGVSAVMAWYGLMSVKITHRESAEVLLEYVPEEVKVLQAESVSETTARRAVVKELTKRMNRQLPERLRDVYR